MKKRVVFIADTHCGSQAGLTPPEWQYDLEVIEHRWHKFAKVQRVIWDFYKRTIESLQPIDVLIHAGDAVEGKGYRSGGTELITADRKIQADMAAECIELAKAKKVVMVYGTPYHTGADEDWEDIVAEKVDACKIGGHEWLDINGLVFDIRHFVSRSIIPYGRYTMLAREQMWNLIWAEVAGYPKADVIVRAHVHYALDAAQPGWNKRMIICPALQMFTKYGTRVATGTVDIGLVVFDVNNKEDYNCQFKILNLASVAAKAIKL